MASWWPQQHAHEANEWCFMIVLKCSTVRWSITLSLPMYMADHALYNARQQTLGIGLSQPTCFNDVWFITWIIPPWGDTPDLRRWGFANTFNLISEMVWLQNIVFSVDNSTWEADISEWHSASLFIWRQNRVKLQSKPTLHWNDWKSWHTEQLVNFDYFQTRSIGISLPGMVKIYTIRRLILLSAIVMIAVF